MTQAEIEAVLLAAFSQCESAGVPLGMEQREILLQIISGFVQSRFSHGDSHSGNGSTDDRLIQEANHGVTDNPLSELTPSQRQAFLRFVRQETEQNRSWKVQLLNDWLQGCTSGSVQFVREIYGLTWLERVQPAHLAEYADDTLPLQVGDRIEVSNSLWEWVQDDGPCSREWFPCTVVAITTGEETVAQPNSDICCTIRFDNGMEYELQSIYDWNRYNWRWAKSANA
jgi:hypothetical protein